MPQTAGLPLPPILVVDDEPIVLTALRETLRSDNQDCVICSDPQAALDLLRQQEFSVIISDHRMPGLSGLELLAEARRLRPEATRVLITAVLSVDTIIQAINQGEIFRFIIKPWVREEFLATVQNAIQRYELMRQHARLSTAAQAMDRQLADLKASLEHQAAVIAQQACQIEQLNQALVGASSRSLEFYLHALEIFEPSLGHAARQAARLCESMASVLHLSADDLRVLVTSAYLCDIGLLAVPRQIIHLWQHAPADLNPEQQVLIERHPVAGQQLAFLATGLARVGEVIRAHHESFDGCGYPDRLRGSDIPWLARVLAVAVAYVSSSSSPGEALDSVKSGAGSSFDPEVVRALVEASARVSPLRNRKEIGLADLRPGMVLARGIYSRRGELLLPEGQALDPACIEQLRSQNQLESFPQSLLVYC